MCAHVLPGAQDSGGWWWGCNGQCQTVGQRVEQPALARIRGDMLSLVEADGCGLALAVLWGDSTALSNHGLLLLFPASFTGPAWVAAAGHGPTLITTISSQGVFPDTFSALLWTMPPPREKRGRDLQALPAAKLYGARVCPQALVSCGHYQWTSPMTKRAQVCSWWGTYRWGSCGSAGMGNRIRAEGRGLNHAPRKEEISSSFLPCSC